MASKKKERELTLKIKAVGPTPADFDDLRTRVIRHAAVRTEAGEGARLVDFQYVDEEEKSSKPVVDPSRFRATVYDYTGHRSLRVEGDPGSLRRVTVTPTAHQPLPNSEEFAEAVDVLSADPSFAPLLRDRRLRPYRPMPPLIPSQLPDGRSERIVAVGLQPQGENNLHEIVGVDLLTRQITRFENHAPANAQANSSMCGQPNAGQQTVKGTPGQAWITISQGRTVLWKFLAVRPAASSGTNGSGVELRYVDYRGKRLLYRAHVPILNVKYGSGPCGPYRDWQNEESKIDATGTDPVPGFRLCTTPAKTILDNGSDNGTVNGVAVYVQGQEVVLVSEMEAGWYRYISQWRFHANGTLRPRFGFSAVSSSCVCNVHYHHVYWRLDFDLRTPGNNSVFEYNDPPIIPGTNWHQKKFEIKRFRDAGHHRKWRVVNNKTKEAYDIVPGANDHSAPAMPDWPYGRGDFWVLRYHSNEIDDGVHAIGPPYEAGIDAWVNGEAVDDDDVVVWYAAHFTHDISGEPPGTFGEIVGPDLVPVKW